MLEPNRIEKQYLKDLWRCRDLFSILVGRYICVRCSQTLIGAACALMRPLLTVMLFTVILGLLAKLPT